MSFVQMTQYIRQMHDAFQGYAAKTVNVGLTIYSQILGTLSQKLGAMIIQYTQLSKNNKRLISNNLNRYSKVSSRKEVAHIYSLEAICGQCERKQKEKRMIMKLNNTKW